MKKIVRQIEPLVLQMNLDAVAMETVCQWRNIAMVSSIVQMEAMKICADLRQIPAQSPTTIVKINQDSFHVTTLASHL